MSEIISALIGGGMALALIGVLWGRITGDIEKKVNRELCENIHKSLDKTLTTIQDDLREIKTDQREIKTGQINLTSTILDFIGQRRRDSEE